MQIASLIKRPAKSAFARGEPASTPRVCCRICPKTVMWALARVRRGARALCVKIWGTLVFCGAER